MNRSNNKNATTFQDRLAEAIKSERHSLLEHRLYDQMLTLEHLAVFMEHQHAFLSSSTLYLTSEALHDNLHDNDGLTSRAHMYERKENSTHRHLR